MDSHEVKKKITAVIQTLDVLIFNYFLWLNFIHQLVFNAYKIRGSWENYVIYNYIKDGIVMTHLFIFIA